jgi:aryl-alcohol dehydrogenase-like predicted oxidoreductase
MEKRPFGRTGMEVSVLGFGGAEIGFRKESPETVARLLNAALDAGLNVLDTGECYSSGDEHPSSEELIGGAVSHRRGDFYLFTKCGHAARFPEYQGRDWSPELLTASIDRSLKRLKTDYLDLKTDYLDLIQLHSCGEEILRQGDVIAVLQKAREAGKARFIGYSGDNDPAVYAVECGAFDGLQTSINIADQRVVEHALPKAKARNMGVIAKRPIANAAWLFDEESSRGAYHYTYLKRLQELAYPFLMEPDSVGTALRFTLSLPGVCTAIVGTSKPDRWPQNSEMLKAGLLSEEKMQSIRSRWQEVARADWVGQG